MDSTEMSHTSGPPLQLSEYLIGLISELGDAVSHLHDADLKFRVNDISVELDVAYTITDVDDRPHQSKPEFWVPRGESTDASPEMAAVQRNTQRVILRLTSTVEDPELDGTEPVPSLPPLPLARGGDFG